MVYDRDKIFTPQLEDRIARIIERADLVLSAGFIIQQASGLSLLEEMNLERSSYETLN